MNPMISIVLGAATAANAEAPPVDPPSGTELQNDYDSKASDAPETACLSYLIGYFRGYFRGSK